MSTSGHFSNINSGVTGGANSYSNTNTTGSRRSGKLHHQSSKSDESKKDDLNVLFNKRSTDDTTSGTAKYKRESDYYRRGSRDRDDCGSATGVSARRSRDSDYSHYRRTGGGVAPPTADEVHKAAKELDTEPWLEVGCVSLGPIIVESASALPIPEHCLHLVQHKYVPTEHKFNF